MSIPRNLDVSALNNRWTHLERCADQAPDRTHIPARLIAGIVDDTANGLMVALKSYGFLANNSDALRTVEAVIYGYIRESNPEQLPGLDVSEGFGEHVAGPAGARVLAQATSDRDAFEKTRGARAS